MPKRIEPKGPPPSSPRTQSDRRTNTVDTPDDSPIVFNEATMPDEVAGLDVEVQAMYERIRGRLGLHPNQRESLGRYEIRGGRIGAGGMGSVYRAYDSEL